MHSRQLTRSEDPVVTHPLSPSVEHWLYVWIALSVIGLFALAARAAYVWAHLAPHGDSGGA